MHSSKLLLVGHGKMGSALLARWHKHPPAGISHFDVIEPDHVHANTHNTHWFTQESALPDDYAAGVVVFAIKPQMLASVLPAYHHRFREHSPLYVSIAAGKNLSFFQHYLGAAAHVVRAMPNTPALIGQGITVLCATDSTPSAARHVATALMKSVGDVEWVDNESTMDAVTALSGSGPAYVFLFLESLTEAGVELGLPKEMARELAIKTVMGSAALAAHDKEEFSILRQQVTSPGGTTEAALAVLMKDCSFNNLLKNAVKKAAQRSVELQK